MAKAKIEKEGAAQESEETSGKKGGLGTVLLVAGVGLLSMMVGAGATFLLLKGEIASMVPATSYAAPNPEVQAGGGAGEGESEGFLGTLFELEPLVVNLEQSKGKRYLKVRMSLELNKESVLTEVEGRLPQIRDAILLMVSGKQFKDVSTIEGKLALRDALVTRVNGFLETGFVKRIYFQEFVVQ